MVQGISCVRLYDNRLHNYGAITNHYKDVYVDIEINGEVLGDIRIEQLITDNYLAIPDKDMQMILKASKKLVKDKVCNFYILDFATKNIERYSVD